MRFLSLPAPLLALIFAVPALSAPSTPNDPFRNLALKAKKPDEGPVCCLRPLPSSEATDDEVLLSFEEWKAKQLASVMQEQQTAPAHVPSVTGHSNGSSGAPDNDSTESVVNASAHVAAQGSPPLDLTEAPAPDAPYFRIPLTDRFNYASTDCSARVHTAHKSAKSPSSILSSKKDRYMLSPCHEKRQFVVVELCDDIRIDTVQLANYEFFSGVFKDFTVSVAKTYTTDTEGWVVAGTYRGKNMRGVQSFHPPTSLGDFYRFIRIDFHSHYGNEYYCPLSLLRVYGLTHLEHWKWDLWESESGSRRAAEVLAEADYTEATFAEVPATAVSTQQSETVTLEVENQTTSDSHASAPSPRSSDGSSEASSSKSKLASVTTIIYTSGSSDISHSDPVSQTTTHLSDATHDTHTTDPLCNTMLLSEATPSSSSSHSVSLSLSGSSVSGSSVLSNQSSQLTRASSTQSHSLTVVPHASPSSSGESIYRTIMNRLTALETNTSLYARFFEDHTANVRDMIRKLGEDVGRLEGLGKAQAQMYSRSVTQFERQQQRLAIEHSELLRRVSRLTDEVVLEKRLGIAQLCLLLAVLVFMALTRGSRSEPVRSRASSIRGWRSRLSGDWVQRLTSRSVSPPPSHEREISFSDDTKPPASTRESSSQGVQVSEGFPRSKRAHPVTGRKLGVVIRPRTPSTIRGHLSRMNSPVVGPTTPTRAVQLTAPLLRAAPRPPIQRAHSSGISQSFSMGMLPSGPKSVKHWARTAHLHEVKPAGVKAAQPVAGPSSLRVDTEVSDATPMPIAARVKGAPSEGDVFGPPSVTSRSTDKQPRVSPVRLPSRGDLPVACAWGGRVSDADGSEGDAWVDTDADDSESELGYDRRKPVGSLS